MHAAPSLPLRATLAVALGTWASVLAVMLLAAQRLYSLPMLVATVFPVVLFATGNPRLFFLVGMVFTSTLGLSINFGRIVHVGGAPSYAIDLMDFFMVPLIVYQLRDFARGERRVRFAWGLMAWWLGLVVLGILDLVEGPHRTLVAFELARMLKLWLAFVVLLNECVRERHFRFAVLALVAAVLMNVAVGFLQFFLRRNLGLEALGEPSADAVAGANLGVYGQFDSVFRVGALMGHPNLFGAFLAMVLPTFLGLLFTPIGTRLKLALGATTLLGCVALVMTLSRSGWISFAAAFVLLLAALFGLPALRARYRAAKLGLLFGAVAMAAVLAVPIITRFTASDSGAFNFRAEWVGVAWRMVLANPVMGTGLNSFSYDLVDYVPYSIPKMIDLFGSHFPVVHNIYMLVWAEQGTAGLLLFLGFHAHLLWIAVGNLRRPVSDGVYMVSLGAACGVVALLVDGLASFYLRVPASGRTFFVMVALIVAARHWNDANGPLRRPTDPTTEPRKRG